MGWHRPDPALRPDGGSAGVPHDKPVAPRCSRRPLCARCTDDACHHRRSRGSTGEATPGAPPLAAGPGAAAFVPLDDPVPARPHGVGAGGQRPDPRWLGSRPLPGDFELPFICNPSATRCASPASPAWRGSPSAPSGRRRCATAAKRVKRVLLAFVTMTGNFSGVPLAFAFIIVLSSTAR